MPFRLIAPLLIAGFMLLTPLHAAAQIRLDLRDVDLRSYIQLVAEETQRNFLLDPDIDGTVSVYAPVSVTPAAMYEIFLNVLEMNGLTIVEGEGIDRILPMVNAAGMAPGVGQSRRGGAFETRVIPVVGDIDEMFESCNPWWPRTGCCHPCPQPGCWWCRTGAKTSRGLNRWRRVWGRPAALRSKRSA